MFFKLCRRAPETRSHAPSDPPRASSRRAATRISPRRYRLVSEPSPFSQQVRIGACVNDLAAIFACARPEIDYMVGRPHHFRIVLDDENRVSEVAQLFENANEPPGVARVQADGRLVQHVTRAHQT